MDDIERWPNVWVVFTGRYLTDVIAEREEHDTLADETAVEYMPVPTTRRGAVGVWNRTYWRWVNTGDAGDMARPAGEDTWGQHPDPAGGQ